MFYYIYKLKEKDIRKLPISEDKFGDLTFNLVPEEPILIHSKIRDYKFEEQKELAGSIKIKEYDAEIPIKLRSKSGFVFIGTDIQLQKIKTVDFLNYLFKNSLGNFIPFDEDEFNLICKVADSYDAKFFFEGQILEDEKIDEEYCKKELDEEYELFEAHLRLKTINNHKFSMYYYGNAIQFPPKVDSEDIEYAIQTFENTMAGI